MSVTDFYLKFSSEQEAKEVLYHRIPKVEAPDPNDPEKMVVTEWMEDEEGNEVWEPNYMNIDNFGIAIKATGNLLPADEDGIQMPEMQQIDGWHVNVRLVNGENGSVLEPYRANPEPVTPMRVFG